jgi:hypothetical protein
MGAAMSSENPMGRINITPAFSSFSLLFLHYYYQKKKEKD